MPAVSGCDRGGLWGLDGPTGLGRPASHGRRRRHVFHPRSGQAGDEPRATLEGQVVPRPVHQYGQAIAEADQEIDMGEAPDQPGHEAGKAKGPELGHGALAADRGHAPEVAIAERRQVAAAGAGVQELRHIDALLLCDGRNPGQGPSVRPGGMGGVAEHEYLRMAGQAEVAPEPSPGLLCRHRLRAMTPPAKPSRRRPR